MQDAEWLAVITATPADDELRLVYADWLEEHSDPRSEYVRLEVALRLLKTKALTLQGSLPERQRQQQQWQARLIKLREQFPLRWWTQLERGPIAICQRLQSQTTEVCPGRWERLRNTELPLTRQCPVCLQSVVLCRTPKDAYCGLMVVNLDE